jgi:hypothetical protein
MSGGGISRRFRPCEDSSALYTAWIVVSSGTEMGGGDTGVSRLRGCSGWRAVFDMQFLRASETVRSAHSAH